MTVSNLQEYFRSAVHSALLNQHVDVEDQTEHYVVCLLTLFARSEHLFEHTPAGRRIKPLVVMLSEALESADPAARRRGLQRLGDVSLFVAGFFAQGFARKLVDIDYHIAMGGQAYAVLAENFAGSGPRRVLGRVFAELAAKFQPLVDVLNEIAASANAQSDRDLLRQYEIYLKTGSQRARSVLARQGIVPASGSVSNRSH
ncbi:MAG: hypothetical protein RML32_08500 [Gammaproteobacteria bacterium]|nr:hypothetical protein [Gammaproteobacteria bacterium]